MELKRWKIKRGYVVLRYTDGKVEKQPVGSYSGPTIKTHVPLLKRAEKKKKAYRKKTPDNTWKPPRTEVTLLQHEHAHDPWRVVVICVLLNRTTGTQVCMCLYCFLES